MGTTNKNSCKTAAVMSLLSRRPDGERHVNGIVSNSDTTAEPIPAREQIEYIDIDRIDDDPNNFYELSGLDELAANIELLGLQQPIRVRPGAEAGRYIIVSGHRRRAAVRQLVLDGHGELRDLPCIVDRSEESAALQELRLIYANSDTRKLSSAEIGKQAERVEALLYQLQEEGYEFPGRMRDHVAEACKVSKTKLARLKVIREKLAPCWQKRWKNNKLPESAAYALAQMPADRQKVISDGLAKQGDTFGPVQQWMVRDYGDKLAKVDKIECKTWGSGPCLNRERMREHIMGQNRWAHDYCRQCCDECEKLASCKYACQLLADKVKQLKADAKAQKQQEAQAEEERERPKVEQIQALWKRFGEARAAAEKSVEECYEAAGMYYGEGDGKKQEKRERLEGSFNGNTKLPYGYGCYLRDVQAYVKLADLLGVSLDYLLCRTDEPAGFAPQPEGQLMFAGWMPGGTLPRTPGRVVVELDFGTAAPIFEICVFDGRVYHHWSADGKPLNQEPVRWMMLPPVPEGGCGDGDS